MPLEFDDVPPSVKTAEMIAAYRQNRDEMRASIRALENRYGSEPVCVAIHMVNLKNIAIAAVLPDDLRVEFVKHAHALVKHWCDASGVDTRTVRTIADGLFEQMSLMKSAMAEAGLPSTVPMPGNKNGD